MFEYVFLKKKVLKHCNIQYQSGYTTLTGAATRYYEGMEGSNFVFPNLVDTSLKLVEGSDFRKPQCCSQDVSVWDSRAVLPWLPGICLIQVQWSEQCNFPANPLPLLVMKMKMLVIRKSKPAGSRVAFKRMN